MDNYSQTCLKQLVLINVYAITKLLIYKCVFKFVLRCLVVD